MAWTVTLEIVDCDSTSTLLSGASVFDGFNTWFTDANGQLIYVVFDDFITAVIVKISKASYIDKNYTISKTNEGTIQTVCLNPAPPPQPDGEPIQCFIVSATMGSSAAAEVTPLRRLRDRVRAASHLAAQLIDEVYREYRQFSPGIAAQLQTNVMAREAVLQIVVRPLLAWYTLAGILGLDQDGRRAASQAAQDVLNACPQHLGARTMVAWLDAIRAGEPLPANAPSFLRELGPRVQEAARFRFAAWAMLDPLARAWHSAMDDLDVIDEVAQWLATAPLEELTPPSDPEALEAELCVLAEFLAFRPKARAPLGERLLTAWPDAAGALERAGLLS